MTTSTKRAGKSAKKRSAPPVAAINRARAEQNIRTKLELLASVAQSLSQAFNAVSSVGSLVANAGSFPTSVRQFNAWSSTDLPKAVQLSVPTFSSSANATLLKNAALHDASLEVIAAVRAALLERQRPIAKPDPRASLRRRLQLAEAIRKIAEKEYADARVEASALRDAADTWARRYEALEREVQQALEARDAEISKLREANAQLTASLRNLRVVKR